MSHNVIFGVLCPNIDAIHLFLNKELYSRFTVFSLIVNTRCNTIIDVEHPMQCYIIYVTLYI